jgi:hypothetical protein
MAQQRRASPAVRAASARKHRAAARKAAHTRKRSAAARKAAHTRAVATAAAGRARVEQLRKELSGAFKNRALLYFHFFDEMRKELGPARAQEIMERAIYQRGVAIGRQFARYAPADMTGIRDAFLKFIPDGGALFAPEVQRCDAGGVDIKFHRCPLKEAWQEAGLAESDIATLCRIAGRVDNGTFEGAGFAFSADTWQPGREGCCHLHIRPGRGGA